MDHLRAIRRIENLMKVKDLFHVTFFNFRRRKPNQPGKAEDASLEGE